MVIYDLESERVKPDMGGIEKVRGRVDEPEPNTGDIRMSSHGVDRTRRLSPGRNVWQDRYLGSKETLNQTPPPLALDTLVRSLKSTSRSL